MFSVTDRQQQQRKKRHENLEYFVIAQPSRKWTQLSGDDKLEATVADA